MFNSEEFGLDIYSDFDQVDQVYDFPLCPVSPYLLDAQVEASQITAPSQSQDVLEPEQEEEEENTFVSVSTTFFQGAPIYSGRPPDVILLSSDAVAFYVHRTVFSNALDSNFPVFPALNNSTTDLPTTCVSDSAPVLNIILHVIYDLPCTHFSLSFAVMEQAVERLSIYGADISSCISPSTPLYALLLSHAPIWPLDIYALAAAHGLESLAVAVSSHLLGFDLSLISNDVAIKMGPIYLKRLFLLHHNRAHALKQILLPPPHPHPASPHCTFVARQKVARAWAIACASFAWDAWPGAYIYHYALTSFKILTDKCACVFWVMYYYVNNAEE